MDQKNWQRGREEEIYAHLAECVREGRDAVLVTVIAAEGSTPRSQGAKALLHADGSITGTVGGGSLEERARAEATRALAEGRCRRVRHELTGQSGVCGGRVELFIEPVVQAVPLWIFGAGHVGAALARAATDLPLRVTVVDDRPAQLAAIEGVATLASGPSELAAAGFVPVPRGAAMVATRDHELDVAFVTTILAAERETGCELAYLGVIGSARKAAKIRAASADDAWARERLERASIPVGLEIGADTPAEIAIGVLAELLAVLRGVPSLLDGDGRPVGIPYRRCRGATRAAPAE